MSAYSTLLKIPGVGRIIAAQLTARLPSGMLSLAFLMHVEQVTGRYADAGLVLAATSIGQAVAGPLTSRWMGRWGMRKVLLLTVIVCTIDVAAFALLPLTTPLYMVLGCIAGLSTPPVQSAVRTIYPKIVPSSQLTPLFSLDASAQEIIWVFGPVMTTFIATQISTTWGILVPVVFLIGGGLWFTFSPEVARVRIPRSRRALGAVLRKPPVLMSIIIGFLLIGATAAVEAGTVATFGHDGFEAGIVLAIFSLGSLVGGLGFGHKPVGPWSLARRMLVIFVGLAAAMAILNVWWLSIALLIAGLGVAPVFAATFAIVSSSVKFSDTAEAYGWVSTGQLMGAALGSASAGILIDVQGPIGAFWASAGFAGAAVIVSAIGLRWLPDLRHRPIGPMPDTEPIPVQPGSMPG